MKRFSKLLAALAGLGLVLTACVPLDGYADAPESSSSASRTDSRPIPVPESTVPVQPYSAAGLKKRISQLPASMAAYQIQQGGHPIEDAESGSEQVILAERFTTSMNFELPSNLTSDHISVELTCSKSVLHSFSILDGTGRETGSSTMGSCSSVGPSGMRTSMQQSHESGQLQVHFEGESDMVLSVVTYTGLNED